MNELNNLYSETFYEGQQDCSVASAEVVVPIILENFPCTSVVDIGCGVGGWLKVFEDFGVSEFLGIDGIHVPRRLLKIPEENFLSADLRELPQIDRFDIACSLEAAEHLPEEDSDAFVEALVAAAPVIVFSAAIPGQGGTNHINEQWQSYWSGKFARHGYLAVDCIRPRIFQDERVRWWYRQNIVVFCERSKVPKNLLPISSQYELDRAHPAFVAVLMERVASLENRVTVPYSGKAALKMISTCCGVIMRAALRKVKKVAGK